jgi:hypothetical protein
MLEKIFQVETFRYLFRANLDPYLPLSSVETLDLEGDGYTVTGVSVLDDGPQCIGEGTQTTALQVDLLHRERIWRRARRRRLQGHLLLLLGFFMADGIVKEGQTSRWLMMRRGLDGRARRRETEIIESMHPQMIHFCSKATAQ